MAAAGAAVSRELRIAEAVNALGQAGVRSLVLKGPSIARWLYTSNGARSYGDSDLLVAPSDISAAEEVVSALGYRRRGATLVGDRPCEAQYWMRPYDGAALDLHQALPGVEASQEVAWALLSAETEIVSLRGARVEVLNQTARTLHVTLHAADHGFSADRPLEEMALALAVLPEDLWMRAASLATALQAGAAFAAGLRLLPEGANLAYRLDLPANDSIEVALRASTATRHALSLEWLMQRRGMGAKAALLGRKLFPPPDYLRVCTPWAAPGPGRLFLAYLRRPLYLALSGPPTIWAWWRARRRLTAATTGRLRTPTRGRNETGH